MPDGSALVYSTYLGGSGVGTWVQGIAVDAAGNAYVTGGTFRPTSRPPQRLADDLGGPSGNAFVAKLTADGSALVYSTYLGGSGGDAGDRHRRGRGRQRLRRRGHLTRRTFPTVNALQSALGGPNGNAFVAELKCGRLGAGLLHLPRRQRRQR